MAAKLAGVLLLAIGLVFQAAPPDAGVIAISLIERPVGVERFELRKSDQGFELVAGMDLTERGSRLQLASTLATATDFTPTRFTSKGKSYRFVNVDTTVTVTNGVATVATLGATSAVRLPRQFFTATGYSPLSGRALLIRYWEAHGRPARLAVVPGTPTRYVTIEYRGTDTVTAGGASMTLRRYSVDGVVWGREAVWLDERDRFGAIVTRVHILPLEGVREDLKDALPQLQRSAIADRMRDLQTWMARAPVVAEGAFALTGARVIDGSGGPPLDDAVVVVRHERIAAIGPRATTAIPKGIRIVDARGATIVPGFWDMHGHASQVEWAPAYLAAGVTTVRDLGAEQPFITAFRDTVATGSGLGPRLLLAGLVDGEAAGAFGSVTAATPQQGRAIVDRYHAAGFEQMKLYSLLQPDVVTAITTRAHELGMTVTGHVPASLDTKRAVEAGMDHVAHLPINGTPGEVSELIRLMAKRRTVVDPTLPWNELLGHAPETAIASFEPGMALAPPALVLSYRSVTNDVDAATAAKRVRDQGALVRALFDAGVPVVAGTDGGLPGHSLLRSIELFVQAGLTPMQALVSATRVPAEAMGLEKDTGTLTVGRRADFSVLDGDPLRNIANIRRIRWVATRGRVLATAELWGFAGFRTSSMMP